MSGGVPRDRGVMDARREPLDLFGNPSRRRPNASLLKWVGSKFRMAEEITSWFPPDVGTYYEVFLGSGSVLATMAPTGGVGSDSFAPLIEIWNAVKSDPDTVKAWYEDRWKHVMSGDKKQRYEEVKASFNARANGPDFLFLARSCYAGIVRFRKRDGYLSTPVGAHRPIPPGSFATRVDEWHARIQGTEFLCADYVDVMERARSGDLIYCDPPYSHSQAILYGSPGFRHDPPIEGGGAFQESRRPGRAQHRRFQKVWPAALRNPIPEGLFERQIRIDLGRSMLRRLQMNGLTLEAEGVTDRLMLTY